MQLRRGWPRLGVALATLAGCPSAPQDPAAELGTGTTEFEALDAGDSVFVVLGPQGGYHIEGSLRVVGIETGDPEDLASAQNPTITFDVLHGGASILTIPPITQGIAEAPPDAAPFTHELLGRRLILSIGDDAELDGEALTLSVSVQDVGGVFVSDAVDVVGEPHPLNL